MRNFVQFMSHLSACANSQPLPNGTQWPCSDMICASIGRPSVLRVRIDISVLVDCLDYWVLICVLSS